MCFLILQVVLGCSIKTQAEKIWFISLISNFKERQRYKRDQFHNWKYLGWSERKEDGLSNVRTNEAGVAEVWGEICLLADRPESGQQDSHAATSDKRRHVHVERLAANRFSHNCKSEPRLIYFCSIHAVVCSNEEEPPEAVESALVNLKWHCDSFLPVLEDFSFLSLLMFTGIPSICYFCFYSWNFWFLFSLRTCSSSPISIQTSSLGMPALVLVFLWDVLSCLFRNSSIIISENTIAIIRTAA